MFEALGEAGVNIQMITTSEIKISVLVDRHSAPAALRVVHTAFALERPRADDRPNFAPRPRSATDRPLVPGAEAAAALGGEDGGMEGLVVSGVELDEHQARVTMLNVPDRPGYAAKVFRAIAEAGVNVDMIVQNVRSTTGDTRLSITVPRADADRASKAVAAAVGDPWQVLVEPAMAKLSVVGVGMRTHTGVATRMFGALADSKINIVLINTSEVRVNVLTDLDRGRDGLRCLEHSFAAERGRSGAGPAG